MRLFEKYRLSAIGIITLTIITIIGCKEVNPPIDSSKKTIGTLSVSTLTSSNGGPFSPRHVLAIWVENNSGQLVKTLLIYAAERKSNLTNWKSNSAGNSTDAITGATQNTHTTRTCSWNGKDASGTLVSNGYYKLCMELADSNGSSTFKTFTFAKDSIAKTATPSNVQSFSNISIKWTPN